MALIAFMMCFGSFIQNEDNRPTINSKKTVDAVKFMAEIYKSGETERHLRLEPTRRRTTTSSTPGTASMILNAISATRTPESDQQLPFADDLWIWPIPSGPHGRFGLEHVMGCYVDLEVRAEQGGRAAVPRRPLHQRQAGDDRSRSSTTSRASRARCRSRTIRKAARGGHAQAAGQVHDPDHDRGEVHAQHRLSGHDERRDRRDLHEVPDPADVRAGVAGQAERRGLGAPHEHRDQEHLRQVAEAEHDLSRPQERAPAGRGRPLPLFRCGLGRNGHLRSMPRPEAGLGRLKRRGV